MPRRSHEVTGPAHAGLVREAGQAGELVAADFRGTAPNIPQSRQNEPGHGIAANPVRFMKRHYVGESHGFGLNIVAYDPHPNEKLGMFRPTVLRRSQ